MHDLLKVDISPDLSFVAPVMTACALGILGIIFIEEYLKTNENK